MNKILDDYRPIMTVVDRLSLYKLTKYKRILPTDKKDTSEYNLTIFDLNGEFIDSCKYYPIRNLRVQISPRSYYCPKRNAVLNPHGILYTVTGIYQRFINMSDRNHPIVNMLSDDAMFDRISTIDMVSLFDLIVVAS